jgi:hypothetical protein
MDLLRSAELRDDGAPPARTRISETVAQLDERVLPTLQQLIERHDAVDASLARYATGELPMPDRAVLDRLRAVEARQRAAITVCVRESVNAEGALLAITNADRHGDVLADEVRAPAPFG